MIDNTSPLKPMPLHTGDTVALVATARFVDEELVQRAVWRLEQWGYRPLVPEGLLAREGQLAGSDEHRAALMQRLVDDPQVRAILCCRGGYGSVRLLDKVDWSPLMQHPKWIVGYSDVTALHAHMAATLHLPTLHATMPIDFGVDEPSEAECTLLRALQGQALDYRWQLPEWQGGSWQVDAPVLGGNLSVLYSLLGSRSQLPTQGCVLLLEDLDEYLYHIDRMMQALLRAGLLHGVRALLVGGLTQMHDNAIPFGLDALQIVQRAAAEAGVPVLAGAPFGHLGGGNMALPLGVKVKIMVDESKNCRIFAPEYQ